MSFEADEEILQDFLIEAGEILEQLNEQLVEMEQRPDDKDLLNAVFRGFHTIKGGASFLGLTPLVTVCHRAEDVFNLLRNGEREVDARLMDLILPVLDTLNDMFARIRAGEMPEEPEQALIQGLEAIIRGESIADAPPAPTVEVPTEIEATEPDADDEPEPEAPVLLDEEDADAEFESMLSALGGGAPLTPSAAPSSGASEPAAGVAAALPDEISDEEFAALLDELHGEGNAPGHTSAPAAAGATAPEADADEITEDEFEALLDQLHGKGQAPGVATSGAIEETGTTQEAAAAAGAPPSPPSPPTTTPAAAAGAEGDGDEITEDEFEALLDQLHGKGKAPGEVAGDAKPAPSTPPPAAKATPPSSPAKPAAPKKAEAPKPAAKAGDTKVEAVQTESTVRVDTKRLDDIMNMVGELVLVRNRLVNLENDLENDELSKAVSNLDVVTADLQTSVMKTRMQPIKKVFGRFPRVVRDLARNLSKEVALEMEGEETDLDKNLVEALADPLVHLVRNAVDHGIEMPDVREAAGKPRKGTVILAAEQEGDHILLSIHDDGAGMDADVLRRKVVEKGLMDHESAARLTDKECFNLIFLPGFSTKSEISDISGRGVGMDVVKTSISQLNGSIDIDSVKGEGTKLTIKVPLTLAIIPTLMIMLSDQIFALPLVSVNEIFNLDLRTTNIIDGQQVVMVRDVPLPIFYLNQWLVKFENRRQHSEDDEHHVVVVHVANQKVGFVVDQLIGQEEVVIKPLGAMLHEVNGLAGATITGDGKIALILDVPGLLKQYARKVL